MPGEFLRQGPAGLTRPERCATIRRLLGNLGNQPAGSFLTPAPRGKPHMSGERNKALGYLRLILLYLLIGFLAWR